MQLLLNPEVTIILRHHTIDSKIPHNEAAKHHEEVHAEKDSSTNHTRF